MPVVRRLTIERSTRGPYIDIGRLTRDERRGTNWIRARRGIEIVVSGTARSAENHKSSAVERQTQSVLIGKLVDLSESRPTSSNHPYAYPSSLSFKLQCPNYEWSVMIDGRGVYHTKWDNGRPRSSRAVDDTVSHSRRCALAALTKK